jgi:hypothetical protein
MVPTMGSGNHLKQFSCKLSNQIIRRAFFNILPGQGMLLDTGTATFGSSDIPGITQ